MQKYNIRYRDAHNIPRLKYLYLKDDEVEVNQTTKGTGFISEGTSVNPDVLREAALHGDYDTQVIGYTHTTSPGYIGKSISEYSLTNSRGDTIGEFDTLTSAALTEGGIKVIPGTFDNSSANISVIF